MDDSKIKTFYKSDFIKNIFTLLSGATLAQLFTFVSIPILTRIYTPEDFGYIAIYISISTILATAATGRFELAIMLPKKKNEALAIVKGTFKIIGWVSFVSLILVLIIKKLNTKLTVFIEPAYFYFIPLSVFIFASINVLLQWQSRNKHFKIQATARIAQSATSNATNIGLGFLQLVKHAGLFIGHILGQALQLMILSKSFFGTEKKTIKNITKKEVQDELKKNLNFPLYSAPMGILNNFSVDILIYVLNLFFSTSMVGLYTNANKVINYPLSIISQSFTSVFYQKISESKKKVQMYLISYFSNFLIATLAMAPIVFWGEEIFSFALGKDWTLAGSIAKYLTPLTITSFAMRNVSNIYSLTRKNRTLLIWQIIYLIVIIIVIFFSKSFAFEDLLLNVSIFGSILYIILAIMGYFILKSHHETI